MHWHAVALFVEHNFCPYWHPIIKFFDLIIDQPGAAVGDVYSDGTRVVGAVDAQECVALLADIQI